MFCPVWGLESQAGFHGHSSLDGSLIYREDFIHGGGSGFKMFEREFFPLDKTLPGPTGISQFPGTASWKSGSKISAWSHV